MDAKSGSRGCAHSVILLSGGVAAAGSDSRLSLLFLCGILRSCNRFALHHLPLVIKMSRTGPFCPRSRTATTANGMTSDAGETAREQLAQHNTNEDERPDGVRHADRARTTNCINVLTYSKQRPRALKIRPLQSLPHTQLLNPSVGVRSRASSPDAYTTCVRSLSYRVLVLPLPHIAAPALTNMNS